MHDFQSEKAVVRALQAAIAAATPETVADALAAHTAPDWRWRGTYPFGERRGAAEVATTFWSPVLTALHRLQRRPDIFLAGAAKGGEPGIWVVETGHLMGLFDRALLSIRPTGRIAVLRYAEFNLVADGRVAETVLYVDLIHLMWQAGQYPLPPQTAAHLVTPGPLTHDGLMYEAQDPARGAETMRAVEALIDNDIPSQDPEEARKLARVWHDDMIWWGPGGIGATYTIQRYVKQHCRPFDNGLAHSGSGGDLLRVAEGSYGGFFGWSNYRLRSTGGFLGMTAGAAPADMAFVDIYRAEGGKLAENWVFIDLLGMLAEQGLDVLGRLKDTGPGA